MEEEFEESAPQEPLPKASPAKKASPVKAGGRKRKSGSPKKPRAKKKSWEGSGSSADEPEPDPLTDPISIDYQEICTDPKFENEGDVEMLDAREFTYERIRRTGLNKPIVFTGQQDILDIKIPDFDFKDVLEKIPSGVKIDVFDHKTEKTKNTLVSHLVEEIQKPAASRAGPLNMLSMEVSYFELGQHVEPPRLVREIDWGRNIFPREKFASRNYSRVEKYAIMTMSGAYTEFHIDFAGTSVWYHVKKGLKVFFVIEPTSKNLHLYEEYINAYRSGAAVGFFGHIVDGETLILPAGWIHSVYTPEDTLVYGGNYLHSFSIPLQIAVRGQETRGQTRKKFTYYCYDQTLWYFVADVVKRALNKDYVRLIARDEYEELVARYRSDPAAFAHCCYDIELPRPEFYDIPHTGEPIQTTFDAADDKFGPPPAFFNQEYLDNLTSFEKAGLLKIKDIVGDSTSLVKSRRHTKVAEGIRRPRNLLRDFEHVVDYITTAAFSRLSQPVQTPVKSEPALPKPERTENDSELPMNFLDELAEPPKPETALSAEDFLDTNAEYFFLHQTGPKPDPDLSTPHSAAHPKPDHDLNPDISASKSPATKAKAAKKAAAKPKKEKKPPKPKSVNGVVSVQTPSTSSSSTPQSRTQPSKRKRSFIPHQRRRRERTPESEDEPASAPRKRSTERDSRKSADPDDHSQQQQPQQQQPPPLADLVPLGRKFAKAHVSTIQRHNTFTAPVAVHGARLHIHVDPHPASTTTPPTTTAAGPSQRRRLSAAASISPKEVKQEKRAQERLFRDMFEGHADQPQQHEPGPVRRRHSTGAHFSQTPEHRRTSLDAPTSSSHSPASSTQRSPMNSPTPSDTPTNPSINTQNYSDATPAIQRTPRPQELHSPSARPKPTPYTPSRPDMNATVTPDTPSTNPYMSQPTPDCTPRGYNPHQSRLRPTSDEEPRSARRNGHSPQNPPGQPAVFRQTMAQLDDLNNLLGALE